MVLLCVKRKTPVVIMFRFVSGYPGPQSLLSFQTQLVVSLDADSFDVIQAGPIEDRKNSNREDDQTSKTGMCVHYRKQYNCIYH